MIAALDEIFATRTLDGWAERFATEPDFFWAPVNSVEDLLADQQFHEAGGLVNVADRDGVATMPMVASPADFHGTPAAPRTIAPVLGQHTAEVLLELGHSQAEIDGLVAAGAVSRAERNERA